MQAASRAARSLAVPVVLVLAALLLTAPAQAATPNPNAWRNVPAKYGVVKQSHIPVTLRDGTVVWADVYRPLDLQTGLPAKGSYPVLLAVTPYGKSSTTTTRYASDYGAGRDGKYGGDGYHPYLVQRGYINAIVEVRGSGSSGGSYDLFSDLEIADGPEFVEWASRLPGSNGKVGLIGASYVGENQLPTAALVGPSSPLKAIAPSVGAYDAYRDIFFPGGLYVKAFFNAYFLGLRYPLDLIPPQWAGQDPVLAVATYLQHLASIGTFYTPTVARLNAGDLRYDGPYWDNTTFGDFIPQIVKNGIPALVIGGHWDLHARGEPREYAAFQNAWARRVADGPMSPTQQTTPRYQMVLGPWYHLNAFQGERYQQILLEWYDTWLKDKETVFKHAENPVHVFDLGTEKWMDTTAFPYREATVKTYYLESGPTGSATSLNDGRLSAVKPTVPSGGDAIDYSPADPLCTRAVEQWTGGIVALGAHDAGVPGELDQSMPRGRPADPGSRIDVHDRALHDRDHPGRPDRRNALRHFHGRQLRVPRDDRGRRAGRDVVSADVRATPRLAPRTRQLSQLGGRGEAGRPLPSEHAGDRTACRARCGRALRHRDLPDVRDAAARAPAAPDDHDERRPVPGAGRDRAGDAARRRVRGAPEPGLRVEAQRSGRSRDELPREPARLRHVQRRVLRTWGNPGFPHGAPPSRMREACVGVPLARMNRASAADRCAP